LFPADRLFQGNPFCARWRMIFRVTTVIDREKAPPLAVKRLFGQPGENRSVRVAIAGDMTVE
jgi:hypothetical protein